MGIVGRNGGTRTHDILLVKQMSWPLDDIPNYKVGPAGFSPAISGLPSAIPPYGGYFATGP